MKYRITGILIGSLALSACATQQPYSQRSAYPAERGYSQSVCRDCGSISRIEEVYGARRNTRAGAVLGGVVGAVAGREIADDKDNKDRNIATGVGAVAGAVAGNAIENKVNESTWDVHVRMDDGRTVVINRTVLAGLREGMRVTVRGNDIDRL